MNISTLTLVLL